MKNEELSASPIKKQGSAAGGKANYRIENSKSQRSENNSKLLTLNSICKRTACGPQTSINHFHTGTMGIPSSMPSSSYVINRQFQSWCALAYFTSGGTSLL